MPDVSEIGNDAPLSVSESESSFPYYRARYYDASAGRFTSEDPIRFRGGFDFYAYVINDPIDSIDPMGLCGPCDNIPPHPQDASVDVNMLASQQNDYRWWYLMVSRWNGPWDYKNYHGQPHPEYDNFGNFNYGATGCANGIPLDVLLPPTKQTRNTRILTKLINQLDLTSHKTREYSDFCADLRLRSVHGLQGRSNASTGSESESLMPHPAQVDHRRNAPRMK